MKLLKNLSINLQENKCNVKEWGCIMDLMKKVALPAMLIGSLAAPGIAACFVPNRIPVTYSANYVKFDFSSVSNIAYSRYEHIGFDGAKYCMQEVRMPEADLIDELDNSCDDALDAFIMLGGHNEVSACDDYEFSAVICKEVEDSFGRIAGSPRTKAVLDYWYEHRDRCDKKECFTMINMQP